MIVRCPDCSSKYEIAADRIPEDGVRVRCPKGKAVFPVRRSGADASARPEPVASAVSVPPRPAPAPEPAAPRPAPAPLDPPEAPPALRPPRRILDPLLARRLARALLQEMLLGRQTEHQKTLADGRALERFGPSLLEAYDLYRGKVSPDLAGSDRIFREAVNDLVGGGKRLL